MPDVGGGWGAISLSILGLFLVLWIVKVVLAWVVIRRPEPAQAPAALVGTPITVLQPLLSGDPTMEGHLRENLAHHPAAVFVWVTDEDDPAGGEVANRLAAEFPGRVQVVVAPVLPAGRSPKAFKLSFGVPLCTEILAVLDDDTVLPPGALERARQYLGVGDLVTGIPVYRSRGGLWSRLVAAFANGNALLTYLPMLHFGDPVTINGMFYLTRRSVLEDLGGFAAISDLLCDDYEIAKLYQRGGRRLVQSTITHPLSTTVPSGLAYVRLIRRWMVCANQVLREQLSVPMAALVVVPSLLPLVAFAFAAVSGSPVALGAVLAGLMVKALAMAVLRRHVAGLPVNPAAVVLECVSDLLLPLHSATALVRPHEVWWRGRLIRIDRAGLIDAASVDEGGPR